MNNSKHSRESLRKSLRDSLNTGDIERVKRAADLFHEAGGAAIDELSSIALKEEPDSDVSRLALHALTDLDTAAGRSIVQRLHSSTGPSELEDRNLDRTDSSMKWMVVASLVALAISWSAHSIYRFNSPTTMPREKSRTSPSTQSQPATKKYKKPAFVS